jgi:hypothetical protein
MFNEREVGAAAIHPIAVTPLHGDRLERHAEFLGDGLRESGFAPLSVLDCVPDGLACTELHSSLVTAGQRKALQPSPVNA